MVRLTEKDAEILGNLEANVVQGFSQSQRPIVMAGDTQSITPMRNGRQTPSSPQAQAQPGTIILWHTVWPRYGADHPYHWLDTNRCTNWARPALMTSPTEAALPQAP